MNKVTKVLWGIVFVALGVLFALNALEIRPMEENEIQEYLNSTAGFISYRNVDKSKVKVIFEFS